MEVTTMFDRAYVLYGKHATYIKFLNAYQRRLDKENAANNAGIFPLAIDVYTVAPLIGVAYNRTAPVDTASSDSTTIFADAIISRQETLDTVYRLVLLSEKSVELTADERIDRAFRSDEDPERNAMNLDLFHQYMRGGVEWLYEQVTEDATTQEDYLARIVELVNLYSEDFGLAETTTSLDFT